MKNTSLLGTGVERVVLMLLAGMASGLLIADSFNDAQQAVIRMQATHASLLHITMPASLSIDCPLPNEVTKTVKAICSLRIG
jgi:hypothetical protein